MKENTPAESPLVLSVKQAFAEDRQQRGRRIEDGLTRPLSLFHYTSVDGLVGIISGRKFFLTDVLASVDRSEIRYGTDLAMRALGARDHPLCQSILATYEKYPLGGLGDEFFVHAACFCAHRDVLTQWRAFSSAGGFALGLDFEMLFQRAQNGEFALAKMIYDREHQEDLLREIVLFACATFDGLRDEVAQMDAVRKAETLNELCVQTAVALLEYIVLFKHPGFQSEEEWRLFTLNQGATPSEKQSFRLLGGRIAPYVELRFEPNLVTEIVRSPGIWPPSIDYALGRVGASLGDHVKISLSDLPF